MSTVLITGANRGIGLALSRIYVGRGDAVIATARDLAAATALESTDGQGRLRVVELDVTREATVAALAHSLTGQTIDLVIVNAGINNGHGGWDSGVQTAAAWSDVLAVNVVGAYLSATHFIPHLEASAAPRIAFVSSRMGSTTLAPGGSYAYRASKAAVTNLACNLARDLAPLGIAVGSYHPGWVRTDMGGAAADISDEESAAGLVRRFDQLSLATTGVFEDYRGEVIPF